jgi:16S rRNA (guanine966-N2)-methyltransferase
VDRKVLDLFAGTGALAIEALSRGARTALLVDNSRAALTTIRKNIAKCGLAGVVNVRSFDLCRRLPLLAAYPNYFDLIFMDPPYHSRLVESTLDRLYDSGALAEEALIVAEHHVDEAFTPAGAFFKLKDQRRYGKTLVSFLTYVL